MEAFLHSYGFVLATTAIVTSYACLSALFDPWSASPFYVVQWVMPLAFIMWVTVDARRRRATPCFDFGFLLYLCWFVAIPWYLVATRGRWGWLTVALFVGLMIGPWVAFFFAVVVSMMMRSIAGIY